MGWRIQATAQGVQEHTVFDGHAVAASMLLDNVVLLRVGNDEHPASQEDIDNVANAVVDVLPPGTRVVVVDHYTEMIQAVPIDEENEDQNEEAPQSTDGWARPSDDGWFYTTPSRLA
jgi:hypothetical protein